MFSLVWEVRNDSTSLAEIVKKHNINAKVWEMGGRISARRRHTTYGFKCFVGDFSSFHDLEEGIKKFIDVNKNVMSQIRKLQYSSEFDIGIVGNPFETYAISLSISPELQREIGELGITLTFTVMLADD